MAGILSTGAQANSSPKIAGLQIQTSVAGKVIPLAFGMTRVPANLIWYGDFTKHDAKQQGAGKGGVLAVGKDSPNAPTYTAAVIMGISGGPINGINRIYADKNLTNASALGLSVFIGGASAIPWGYMSSAHPTEARGYRRTAYVSSATYALGNSGTLPNHSFEVQGIHWGAASVPDAAPDDVITYLLTDSVDGIGFPQALDFTIYRDYVFALSLFISPLYDDQAPTADRLAEIAAVTNSEFVIGTDDNVNSVLRLIPYGDTTATANGHTYTPPHTSLVDLGPADFQPSGSDPMVRVRRKRPSDRINLVKREYLNRPQRYVPANVSAPDAAAIQQYGRKEDQSQATHMFTTAPPARLSAQLTLQRQQVANQYDFKLDARYDWLDPMDLVTITEPSLGLDRQPVLIIDIEEDERDLVLVVQAEEWLGGVGDGAVIDIDAGSGYDADYNSAPDASIQPVIFEPPSGLVAGRLEVWIGTAGSGPNWGGADVWLSTDGDTYQFAGSILSGAQIGVLTASLPSVLANPVGETIDTTHTLAVDLAVSSGALVTSSEANALALNTICYVDGEILAFANATPTGSFAYNLTFLVRGAYDDTLIATHASGSRFMLLDSTVLRIEVTSDRVGQTVYVKLLAKNIYGGGQEQLADVSPYAFTVEGQSILSPLPNVANFRVVYRDGNMWLYWDEVSDPRPVLYEVRKGVTWESAQFLTRLAHPPVPTFGDDTYWVAGFTQPTANEVAYSPNPSTLSLVGTALVANVLASYDEKASGWTGTLSAGIETSAGNIRTKLGQTSGTYEVPSGHIANQGRNAPMAVWIDWAIIGQYWSGDFLGGSDVLGTPDFLGASATALVSGFPEISISNDGTTFGAWVKYAPGTYMAWKVKARMGLSAPDPSAACYCTAFKLNFDPQDRTDFYANVATSGAGDTTTNFRPAGAGADAAFNGGPGGASVPSWNASIRDLVAGDDFIMVTLTLSAAVYKVVNAGARVVRHVDLTFQGF